MRIRSLLLIAVLMTAVLFSTGAAKAADTSSIIAQLMEEIAKLTAQLQALQAQQGQTQTWCHTFNVD